MAAIMKEKQFQWTERDKTKNLIRCMSFCLRDMQPKTGFASFPSSCRLLPSLEIEN